jgi:hypothetical protein
MNLMPKINLSIPHGLSQTEASARIKSLLNDVKTQHADKFTNLQETWTDHAGKFSCSVMGLPVTGILTISPSHVEITGELPLAAMLFKGKLESMIKEHAATLLA